MKMEGDFARWILSVIGGGLVATWGMLRWTNDRIRKLELDRVTPADCQARVSVIGVMHQAMWTDIKRTSEAVARIEGYLKSK